MAFAKLQQSPDNKQLSGSSSGMTGNAVSGAQKGATSAPNAGFTNIQDYMGANKGDKTNENYLNTKADENINAAKGQMQSNVSNLSAINQPPEATEAGLQDIFKQDNYQQAKTNATAPTAATFGNIEDPTQKLQGNMTSTMDYLGSIKPQSQSYTKGMAGFDEMLLGQNPDFAKNFAENRKAQFQNEVKNPYEKAQTERRIQEQQATDAAKRWQDMISQSLQGYNTGMNNYYNQLRQAVPTGQVNYTYNTNSTNLQEREAAKNAALHAARNTLPQNTYQNPYGISNEDYTSMMNLFGDTIGTLPPVTPYNIDFIGTNTYQNPNPDIEGTRNPETGEPNKKKPEDPGAGGTVHIT